MTAGLAPAALSAPKPAAVNPPARHAATLFTYPLQSGVLDGRVLLQRLQALLQEGGCGPVTADLARWSLTWPLQVQELPGLLALATQSVVHAAASRTA